MQGVDWLVAVMDFVGYGRRLMCGRGRDVCVGCAVESIMNVRSDLCSLRSSESVSSGFMSTWNGTDGS